MNKMRITRLFSAVCALLVFLCCITPSVNAKAIKDDFVKVRDRGFVCGGREYVIKGMAMGNNVWSNPKSAPVSDHNESSYKELSELGFNSVRFYLNYGLFETESGTRREEGFKWIDKNIRWGKKYGIRLILNMHYPQGGYQSGGNGDRLWTDKDNQNRLIRLWGDIAEKYANEPYIIGYGLVNEPVPVGRTSARDGLAVWKGLAQKITDRIRKKDKNHIIFIERVLSVKDPKTMEQDWSLSTQESFVRINDPNTAYEFHIYDPYRFTHQGFDWAGTTNAATSYPSDNIIASGVRWLGLGAVTVKPGKDWQSVSSDRIYIRNEDTNAVAAVFQAAYMKNGHAYAKDICIDVYDASGKRVKTVKCDPCSFNFWSADSSGRGITENSVLHISDTADDANMSSICIEHKKGYSYTIRGKVRTDKEEGAKIAFRVDSYHAESMEKFDKTMLEKSMSSVIDFSKKYNVPIYCGEFGAGINCFADDRGGDRWVTDMLSILNKNKISYNYHSYNDGSFGLYRPVNGKLVRSDKLAEVFTTVCEKTNMN
ncbi:MAG: cellulase family glycosylhydrolase [Oribacterium sp.]|nr:cellulase family glycosylhydrolase [Oribacterium sp.]